MRIEMYRRCAESNRSNTSNAAAAGLDADDFSWDELDAIRAYGDDIAHVYIRGREEGIPAADLVAVIEASPAYPAYPSIPGEYAGDEGRAGRLVCYLDHVDIDAEHVEILDMLHRGASLGPYLYARRAGRSHAECVEILDADGVEALDAYPSALARATHTECVAALKAGVKLDDYTKGRQFSTHQETVAAATAGCDMRLYADMRFTQPGGHDEFVDEDGHQTQKFREVTEIWRRGGNAYAYLELRRSGETHQSCLDLVDAGRDLRWVANQG